jgi:hypothetical protein
MRFLFKRLVPRLAVILLSLVLGLASGVGTAASKKHAPPAQKQAPGDWRRYPGPTEPPPTGAPSRADERKDRYHWYGLSDAQMSALTVALKAIPPFRRQHVWVLCDQVTDCRDLAQDFHTAFEEAGWDVDLERPAGVVDGLHVTCPLIATALEEATKIPTVLDDQEDKDNCAVNLGRKRALPN